jgi:hypothetical protein
MIANGPGQVPGVERASDYRLYIIDLPVDEGRVRRLPYEVQGIYSSMHKMGVSSALTPLGAVRNLLFRTFRDKSVARRVFAGLDNPEGTCARYAHEYPQVAAVSGEHIGWDEREIFEEMSLAEDMAIARGGNPAEYLGRARELMRFARRNRAEFRR